MNLKGWISWQIILVCAGCVLFGAGVAAVVTVYFLQSEMAALAGDVKRKTERVRLLEGAVLQQSRSSLARALDQAPTVSSREEGEVGPVVAEVSRAPVATELAQTVEVAKSSAKGSATIEPGEKGAERGGTRAKTRDKTTSPAVAPASAPRGGSSTAVAAAAAQQTPSQAQPPRAVVEESAGDTTAVPTAAEVAAVVKNGRIEGVGAEKAGVERLSANAVHLRGGRTIKVGSMFPSGERLLAVDPENGRIVTNQRQILMFF